MLKKNFTKKEIINKVYQNLGFSKKSSSIIIDDFFEFIVSELKKLNKVKISSFGTFVITNKNENDTINYSISIYITKKNGKYKEIIQSIQLYLNNINQLLS